MSNLSKKEVKFLIREAKKEIKTFNFLQNGDALYLMFRHYYPDLSNTIKDISVFDENDFEKLRKIMVAEYVK